jgi:hypothetical protein
MSGIHPTRSFVGNAATFHDGKGKILELVILAIQRFPERNPPRRREPKISGETCQLRTGAAAFFGWPDDPAMEELRERWLGASDDTEQKHIAARMQETALAALRAAGEVCGLFRMAIECIWNPEVEPTGHVEHIQVVTGFCELGPWVYSHFEFSLWGRERSTDRTYALRGPTRLPRAFLPDAPIGPDVQDA